MQNSDRRGGRPCTATTAAASSRAATGSAPAPAAAGCSTTSGRLVGILTFRLRGGEAHYFAAPVEWVRPMLDEQRRGQFARVMPLDTRPLPYWQKPSRRRSRVSCTRRCCSATPSWGELALLAHDWLEDRRRRCRTLAPAGHGAGTAGPPRGGAHGARMFAAARPGPRHRARAPAGAARAHRSTRGAGTLPAPTCIEPPMTCPDAHRLRSCCSRQPCWPPGRRTPPTTSPPAERALFMTNHFADAASRRRRCATASARAAAWRKASTTRVAVHAAAASRRRLLHRQRRVPDRRAPAQPAGGRGRRRATR